MRKVFKNRHEVAHVWASRSQDEGRAGNVHFRDGKIYSYGWWEMARFMEVHGETIVLMRSWSYSSETAKHMNSISAALRGLNYRIVTCYGQVSKGYNSYYMNEVLDHEQSLRCWLNEMYDSQQKLKRAKYPEWQVNNNHNAKERIEEYCALFDLPIPEKVAEYYLEPDNIAPLLAAKKKRAEELEANAEERAAKRMEQLRKKFEKEIADWNTHEERWMNGENVSTSFELNTGGGRNSWRYNRETYQFSQTRLRIKDDYVETSRQAYVSVREAKILWDAIKMGHDIKGHRIGNYTVIGLNGTLKIGCHEITREEMQRFTAKYGW